MWNDIIYFMWCKQQSKNGYIIPNLSTFQWRNQVSFDPTLFKTSIAHDNCLLIVQVYCTHSRNQSFGVDVFGNNLPNRLTNRLTNWLMLVKQGSRRAYGTAVRVAVEPLIELPLYHSVVCIIRCSVPKVSHWPEIKLFSILGGRGYVGQFKQLLH